MTTTPQSSLIKDPVCGMLLDPAKAKATAEHAGETYYFCCTSCAEKFQVRPEEYLKLASSPPALVTLGAPGKSNAPLFPAEHPAARSYVCLMCNEVRQTKPGPCPKCGMALEPELQCPKPNTPARCTPRSFARNRGIAQSAGWRSSPEPHS